jgi:hypothetical protein
VVAAIQLDPKLKEFATPRQCEYIDAVILHGGINGAARALKVAQNAVSQAIQSAKLRAATAGYAPEHHMTHPAPPGFSVKGVSTYFDSEGQARGQWVKTSADQEARDAALREAAEAMASEMPRLDPLERPAHTLASVGSRIAAMAARASRTY